MKIALALIITLLALSGFAQTNVIYAKPKNQNGNGSSCPGVWKAYANYIPTNYVATNLNRWGFHPSAASMTATTLSASNWVQIVGIYGDVYCNTGRVVLSSPFPSPVYQFAVYFKAQQSTNPYPLTTTGCTNVP